MNFRFDLGPFPPVRRFHGGELDRRLVGGERGCRRGMFDALPPFRQDRDVRSLAGNRTTMSLDIAQDVSRG